MIIGITGGSGSGKSTLLQVLEDAGAVILDCDAIYHELLQTDTAMLCAIENRFPGVTVQGKLDRKKLGAIVFADAQALRDLNDITHTHVKKQVLSLLPPPPALAAIDAIELFDGGLAVLCDATVAIVAREEDRIRRLTARDGISREQAILRIRAQKPEDYFRNKCDFILENFDSQEDFYKKCLVFFRDRFIIKEKQ